MKLIKLAFLFCFLINISNATELKNKINNFFAGFNTMQAEFVQYDNYDNTKLTKGLFYIDRPGKLRFEYHSPFKSLLINNKKITHYYDIDLDLSTNSIFSALDTSNYAYLYYQLYIIRSNIGTFVNAKDMYQYLLITTKNEFYFYDGENFCIYASYQYIRNYYKSVTDPQTFLEQFSSLVSGCRKLGNGIRFLCLFH